MDTELDVHRRRVDIVPRVELTFFTATGRSRVVELDRPALMRLVRESTKVLIDMLEREARRTEGM